MPLSITSRGCGKRGANPPLRDPASAPTPTPAQASRRRARTLQRWSSPAYSRSGSRWGAYVRDFLPFPADLLRARKLDCWIWNCPVTASPTASTPVPRTAQRQLTLPSAVRQSCALHTYTLSLHARVHGLRSVGQIYRFVWITEVLDGAVRKLEKAPPRHARRRRGPSSPAGFRDLVLTASSERALLLLFPKSRKQDLAYPRQWCQPEAQRPRASNCLPSLFAQVQAVAGFC